MKRWAKLDQKRSVAGIPFGEKSQRSQADQETEQKEAGVEGL